MDRVSKEYRKIDGQDIKVELYYSLGGYNNIYSKTERRGYYVSITPVELTEHDGYTTERFLAFSGIKKLLLEVNRKSKLSEKKAENLMTEELLTELINYVMNKAA